MGNLFAPSWQLALFSCTGNWNAKFYTRNILVITAPPYCNWAIHTVCVTATNFAIVSRVQTATSYAIVIWMTRCICWHWICYCGIVGPYRKGDGPAATIWNWSDWSPCCNCVGPCLSGTLEPHTPSPTFRALLPPFEPCPLLVSFFALQLKLDNLYFLWQLEVNLCPYLNSG